MTVGTHGGLKQRYVVLSPFDADARGGAHGNRSRDVVQLDVGGRFEVSRQLWMRTTLQVFDGQVLGDESALHAGPRSRLWHNGSLRDDLFLREAVVQVPIGLGEVRVGRRAGDWGLGMAIHDGRATSSPFADPHDGDIYNGIIVDAMPLRAFVKGRAGEAVRLHLGFDVIERDELVDRKDGDLALRYSGAILWEERLTSAGAMIVHRNVDLAWGERSDTLFDVTMSVTRPIARDLQLIVSAEGAALVGDITERPRPPAEGESAGAPGRTETRVRQFGAMARVELEAPARGIGASLELGAASGDDDALDGNDTAFRFDPAHRVGMILFEEVLARATAATRSDLLAGDSDAPRGRVDAFATGGSISSAAYAAPLFRVEACNGCFIGHVGGLVAFAPVGIPAPDPAASTSKNANPYGGKATKGLLGWEVNLSAEVRVALPDTAEFSIGTQYGVFRSGPALRARDGRPEPGMIHKWRVLADVSW
ncbi:MAG: hypothetical protein R3F39_13090 [Myxococcota bacterium]